MITNTMIKDALRYIGASKEKDELLIEKVKLTFQDLQKIALPKVVYKSFPIKVEAGCVYFEGTTLSIKSQDLCRIFAHTHTCYILAATLGGRVDQVINRTQRIDMLDAIVLDACASVLVDKVCDDLEAELFEKLVENEYFTMRFSPGYGDVPLECQDGIIQILEAEKRIGVTLTKAKLLFPTKSITALIGISNQKENRAKTCGTCNLVKTCVYRRRGEQCGK